MQKIANLNDTYLLTKREAKRHVDNIRKTPAPRSALDEVRNGQPSVKKVALQEEQ